MSGMEVLAVVACVAAVCSAYHDGGELLEQVTVKRNARKVARRDALIDDSTQDLRLSLTRGESVVQSQYDRDYRRFGAAFADGDSIAKDALKAIAVRLQAQVISSLKIQLQQDTYLDFTALQDVSDSSQDEAILVLMQLQQRIITSGPIEHLKPPPLFAKPVLSDEKPPVPPLAPSRRVSGRPVAYPTSSNGSLPQENRYPLSSTHGRDERPQYMPLVERKGQPQGTLMTHSGTRLSQRAPGVQYPRNPQRGTPVQDTSPSQHAQGYFADVFGDSSPGVSEGSMSSPPTYQELKITPKVVTTITSSGNEKSEKSNFASVTKVKLFGTRPKANPMTIAKNEPCRIQELDSSNTPKPSKLLVHSRQPNDVLAPKVQKLKDHPPPPPTLASYRDSSFSALSETTTNSSYEPSETPNSNCWVDQSLPITPATSRNPDSSSGPPTLRSSGTTYRVPAQANMTKCPNPINPRDLLPSEANKFQGFCKGAWRAQIGDMKKAMEERQRPGGMYNAARFWQCTKCKFEGRLLMLDKKTKSVDRRVLTAEGLQFRWDFLFKSHIETKDATSDFLGATFGCIFCTAEGKGNPIFGGAQMLMAHLQGHRERLPTGEVLYRMNTLAGPRAALDEDFDINIIAKEGVNL